MNKSTFSSPLLSVMTGRDSGDIFSNDFNINEGILKSDPNLKEKDSYLADRTDVELSADDSLEEKDYSLLLPKRVTSILNQSSFFSSVR
jgi:hypothetical protein